MMKHALAGVLLIVGLLATGVRAHGAEGLMPASECADCDAPRNYDSQEVRKTTRDVDHSRVINTTSFAPPALPRQNEASVARIRVRSDVTLVNFVVHKYRVIEAPAFVEQSEPAVRPHRPSCKSGKRNRYDCPPLRVRG